MKLIFATHNKNKSKELTAKVPNNIELLNLDDIGYYDEIEETGNSLEENARIKSSAIYNKYGIPCFADDTGLFVNALNGEPGVYSARYSGPNSNSKKNISLLLKKLSGQTDRSAYFKTVFHLILDENIEYLFEGKVTGEIVTTEFGEDGFGYDPIFIADGMVKTFAQISLEKKNTISHRAIATEKMLEFLSNI